MKKRRIVINIILFISMIAFLSVYENVEAVTVKLNRSKLVLEVGKSEQLRMNGTKKNVIWSSKNEKIASVDSEGRVKAIQPGTTNIFAKVGKKRYTCKVTVLPVFQIDETEIRKELDGRFFSVNGDEFQVQEDEIGKIAILSKYRNKDNTTIQLIAEVEINRTIATFSSEITFLYQNGVSGWKLKKVSEDTKVEEWHLEGTWKGGIDVYDYSRNASEYRDLTLEIYDVKADGIFECEALLEGVWTDSINMSGEIDLDTGEIQIYGLDWIEDNSELAQDLSKRGKIYSFYGIPDFANDAFITNEAVSTRVTYVSDMVIEKELEEENDIYEEFEETKEENIDIEEEFIYEE